MKKKVIEGCKALKDKAQAAMIATSLAIMMMPVHAAYEFDIPTALTNLLNLVYTFVGVGGVINIILGARSLAAGLNDDGGGQDQQKIAKGKGQIISGFIGVGAISILTLLKVTPSDIIAQMNG